MTTTEKLLTSMTADELEAWIDSRGGWDVFDAPTCPSDEDADEDEEAVYLAELLGIAEDIEADPSLLDLEA